ncbi:inner membrane protein [Escherichia coli]|nr:inner membrane protein [Escherichia coli]
MSQDSKVLSRAFLGIGLILLVISAIIFYYHFTCGVVINSGRSSCSQVEPASLAWRGVW